jgi:hypothetical protein
MNENFFKERVLEMLQRIFAPLYRRVHEKFWNNGTFAYVRRPYYFCNFQDGVYEIYIPTMLDGENRMGYYRIAVKVVEELDEDSIRREQPYMMWAWTTPMGKVESELIVYIARRTNEKQRRKGIIKGFKHSAKPGYFTAIFVNKNPEITVKRLEDFVSNFIEKRIRSFLEKLKLPQWMFEEHLRRGHKSSLLILIEKYSLTIRNNLHSMLETLLWIRDKARLLEGEIKRQEAITSKLKPLMDEVKNTLKVFTFDNPFKNPNVRDPQIIERLLEVFPIEKG